MVKYQHINIFTKRLLFENIIKILYTLRAIATAGEMCPLQLPDMQFFYLPKKNHFYVKKVSIVNLFVNKDKAV